MLHRPIEHLLSARALQIPPSDTLSVMERVAALKQGGMAITNFSNRPATPYAAIQAAQQALEASWSAGYADVRGVPQLRQEIARRSARLNGIVADLETEILVTVGAKEAIFLAMMALLDPGDEVLLPDPEWVSYDPCIRLAGGNIVRFPLWEENGFAPDPAELRARVTPRTKMIVLNTPHNPTGAIFSRAVLEEIGRLAQEYDLIVLSDEVYENYVYDNQRHISIATLPGMAERTITISGTSKIFNMFGWRIGWAIGHRSLIDRMANIHQHTCACATSFAQAGTVAVLQLGDDIVGQRVAQYRAARDALVPALNEIPGISCHMPAGAYFAFPNVAAFGLPSSQVASLLLEQAGIQSVAGSAFGEHGEGHLRLVFACTDTDVADGAARLRSAFAALARQGALA